jgi:hypothetical protein
MSAQDAQLAAPEVACWWFPNDPGWFFSDPLPGGDMQQVSAFPLYRLGFLVGRAVANFPIVGDSERHEDQFGMSLGLLNVIPELRSLATNPFVPLPNLKSEAGELADLFSKLAILAIQSDDMSDHAQRKTNVQSAILEKVEEFRVLLSKELAKLDLFFVPQRLAYSTDTLLRDAARLFGSFKDDLVAIAGRDIEEAATCFVFAQHTAAAFHMLRACELVLVEYCGACKLTIPDPSWGAYCRALGTVRDLPPRMKGRLDRLREYDRNTLFHPGRFLDEDEADDLFDYVRASMKDMMRDINKRRAGKGKP